MWRVAPRTQNGSPTVDHRASVVLVPLVPTWTLLRPPWPRHPARPGVLAVRGHSPEHPAVHSRLLLVAKLNACSPAQSPQGSPARCRLAPPEIIGHVMVGGTS